MADRGDTHYPVSRLNRWFAVSSILLLAASAWMVIDDWNAPWKQYQAEFRQIETRRARARLAEADMLEAQQQEERLQAELDTFLEESAGYEERITQLEEELAVAEGQAFTASEAAKSAKQDYNYARWEIEEYRAHHQEPEYGVDRLAELQAKVNELEAAKEAREFDVKAKEAELEAARSEVFEIESEIKSATADLSLVRAKLDKLDPEAVPAKVANFIRDFPGLDFIDPKNQVEKVVLDDLTFDLNFTKKQRIDMCETCHQAVNKEGYVAGGIGMAEDAPLEQPHLSHPRLDLYLSAKSPHPMKDIGCTICHRGSGEALQFVRVDHRPMGNPKNEDEWGEEWKDEYHWHKQHHWDYPMLRVDDTEASCVQCHKTSMELIAEDAPKVTEGYRLFERYGCYACHKVDWFPVKRKPAPSLKKLASKLEPDWVASWIADPKGFRPTTWMPQIFHLENYAPEDVVVASKWSEGRDIMGQEWNDTAVASITAFLYDQEQSEPLPPVPVEGDPERGREVFRVSGCLACHNLEGYEGEPPQTKDLAFEPNSTNIHGPNLRGVATKLSREWLYAWIKDPQAYWPETRMPNLRLSDQDAADATAYIMDDPDGYFHDVPDDWEVAPAPSKLDVLQEQARWFFTRLGRKELEGRFAGEVEEHRWDREADLLVEVGEKFMSQQGCFSCHDISGWEEANPIGVELTNWGSRTVDKLVWGVLPQLMQQERGWSPEHREEFKQYREHWLAEKLHNPRIFDRETTKNPTEKLKMPYFGFTDDQVDSLVTFVIGLVDDEVQRAKMVPTSAQQAMNDGMRVVRRMNCEACHQLSPGEIEVLDEDGHLHSLTAELMPLGDDNLPPHPQDREALDDAIASYEEYWEEEIDEVGVRLLGNEPGYGAPGSTHFFPPDRVEAVHPPKGGDFVRVVTDYYFRGIEMFDPEAGEDESPYYAWNLGPDGEVEDVDGELRAYYEEQYDKIRWTFAPPVLWNEGFKVQREWFYSFLTDPVPLRKQMRVKMPTFHFREGEAEAVADYFAYLAEEEHEPRYTETLRLALDAEPIEGPDGGPSRPWPELANYQPTVAGLGPNEVAAMSDVSAASILLVEAGSEPAIESSFGNLRALGEREGFVWRDRVDPHYEAVERRSPTYLDERSHLIPVGEQLAVDAVNCYQCHWHGGEPPDQEGTPIAWAPDLSLARERLREGWTRDWLWKPSLIYPGTAMPANFASDPASYQEIYPDSTNAEQIQAVMDWLYNFDRIPASTEN